MKIRKLLVFSYKVINSLFMSYITYVAEKWCLTKKCSLRQTQDYGQYDLDYLSIEGKTFNNQLCERLVYFGITAS